MTTMQEEETWKIQKKSKKMAFGTLFLSRYMKRILKSQIIS